MKDSSQIKANSIELPSNLKYVKKGSSFVLEGLVDLDIDEATLYDIKFSVEEALINAMKYGNKLVEALKTKLSFILYKDKIEITIEDCGNGFDYENIPDPTKDNNAINRHSGRGIFLIKHLMDSLVFNEKGNIIKMVKRFHALTNSEKRPKEGYNGFKRS